MILQEKIVWERIGHIFGYIFSYFLSSFILFLIFYKFNSNKFSLYLLILLVIIAINFFGLYLRRVLK